MPLSDKQNRKSQAIKDDFKNKLIAKREAKEKSEKFILLFFFSVFSFLLMGIPVAFTVGIKQGIAVGAVIPIIVLSYSYPRQALWVFLVYMPFGGTLTYSIGQGNTLFQVAKDAFYLPALIKLMQEAKRKNLPLLIPRKILPSLAILLFFCLLTLFSVNALKQTLPACSVDNPVLTTNLATGELVPAPCRDGNPFFQGLFGLKVLLGYFPLAFCAYYLIKDKKTLFFLGRVLVVVAIICCVLALAQYWMLKTGRCVGTRNEVGVDLYKPNLEARCLVGGSLLYSPNYGQIRLPGTFVSPWHWSWFLVGNAAISYAMGFSEMINAFMGETLNIVSLGWGIAGLVSLVLVLLNAIICGQRLAFLMVPLMIVVLLVLTFFLLLTSQGANTKQVISKLKTFIPIIIGVAGFIVLGGIFALSFFNPDFIQERYDSFVERWNQGNPFDFTSGQYDYVARQSRGILGAGVGSATSSARFFGEIAFVETFHPKLVFELGWPGFLAFMGFITHLTILCFKAYRSVRDASIGAYGAGFWAFMVVIGYFPYWYPLDTDPVAVYYWFFAGVILKLPDIEKQEKQKLEGVKDKIDKNSQKSKLKRKKFSVA